MMFLISQLRDSGSAMNNNRSNNHKEKQMNAITKWVASTPKNGKTWIESN